MFKRPVVVYSTHCKHSIRFMETLMQHSELFDSFIRLNIDIDPQTRKRPKLFSEIQQALQYKISEVPTIIVENAKYVLAGEEAFKWLEEVVAPPKESVSGFNPIEMSAFSDSYAHYGNTSMNDNTADQCFKFLNKTDEKINTPQEDTHVTADDYTKKQLERESFQNTSLPTSASGPSAPEKYSSGSQKQKELDSRYQQLLMERDQVNSVRPRV
jgi:hypothetical protein